MDRRYQLFTKQRNQFIKQTVHSAITMLEHTFGKREDIFSALGLKKITFLRIERGDKPISVNNFFRILQSMDALETFTQTILSHLKEVEKDEYDPPCAQVGGVYDISEQMIKLKKSFNEKGGVFAYGEPKITRSTSFITTKKGESERRYALYRIMNGLHELKENFNIRREMIMQHFPSEKPLGMATLHRLFRPSGEGLERWDKTIPFSDHNQTAVMTQRFLAVLQIIPALVHAQRVEARYRVEGHTTDEYFNAADYTINDEKSFDMPLPDEIYRIRTSAYLNEYKKVIKQVKPDVPMAYLDRYLTGEMVLAAKMNSFLGVARDAAITSTLSGDEQIKMQAQVNRARQEAVICTHLTKNIPKFNRLDDEQREKVRQSFAKLSKERGGPFLVTENDLKDRVDNVLDNKPSVRVKKPKVDRPKLKP